MDRRRWPRRVAVAAAFAVAFAAPARAATSGTLHAALAFVPVPAPSAREMVEFVNFAGLAALTGKRGGEALRAASARLAFPAGAHAISLAVSDPAKFAAAAGFGLEHIADYVEFGDPPRRGEIYVLAAGAPPRAALEEAWAERGFRERPSEAGPVWGRGEPFKIDMSRVDRSDPFGGDFGRGSFLLSLPPALAESTDPKLLVEIARARGSGGLGARPDIAAMLAALDREFGAGTPLQATLFPNPAAMLASPGGGAPYTALLLADIEQGTAADTAFVLMFGDCAAARAARSEIERRWPEAVKAMPRLPTPIWTVAESAGPCALVGRVHDGRPAAERRYANTTYRPMLATFVGGHLEMLFIRGAR